jgi:hypothetical protein
MNNNNDVSDWSISFVTSYLIGQSFYVPIGQLFMKWSFLIGSFSPILIGGSIEVFVFCPFKNGMVNVPQLPCIGGVLLPHLTREGK